MSRLSGGGLFADKINSQLPEAVFSLCYGAAIYIYTHNIWYSIVATGAIYAAKQTGHGEYLDYGRRPYDNRDHTLSPVVNFLWFKVLRQPDEKDHTFYSDELNAPVVLKVDSRAYSYLYDFTGMAVTGAALSIPLGVTIGYYAEPLTGLFWAFLGCSKAVAYSIGWKLRDITGIRAGWSEYIHGFFDYAVLAAFLWLYVL